MAGYGTIGQRLWADSIVESGNDIMYAINIPRESITIPETMDAVCASMRMQLTREVSTVETNRYPGIRRFRKSSRIAARPRHFPLEAASGLKPMQGKKT